MLSPLGHALAGITVGTIVAGARRQSPVLPLDWGTSAQPLLLFAMMGVLADVDFLFGLHNMYTHSAGASVVVALAIMLVAREGGARFGIACGAAYFSHVLLDWLGTDNVAPIGVMALWPFADEFYYSGWRWFMSISREYGAADFWSHNLRAVVWEIVWLGSPLVAVLLLKLRLKPPNTNKAEPRQLR